MRHGNSGFGRAAGRGALQIANRFAYRGMENAQPPRRRLEQACVSLQDAAEELEGVLAALPSPTANGAANGVDDIHEAIGTIMETLRLLNDAYGRLETRDTLRVVGSDN